MKKYKYININIRTKIYHFIFNLGRANSDPPYQTTRQLLCIVIA